MEEKLNAPATALAPTHPRLLATALANLQAAHDANEQRIRETEERIEALEWAAGIQSHPLIHLAKLYAAQPPTDGDTFTVVYDEDGALCLFSADTVANTFAPTIDEMYAALYELTGVDVRPAQADEDDVNDGAGEADSGQFS